LDRERLSSSDRTYPFSPKDQATLHISFLFSASMFLNL
jgi:hypothetical protein